MNGRFRSACIRCANLAGKSDNVKLAEENNASAERGGRPCLQGGISAAIFAPNLSKQDCHWYDAYFTKSAKLNECNGSEDR